MAVAATVVFAAGVSAASTVSKPAAGTIHIFVVNTSLSSTAPNHVLITGAFSDHGTGKGGTFHLTKGTITSNLSKLKAVLSSPSFGTFYPASCSFSGVAKGSVPIVSGTGAYAGIKGHITVTVADGNRVRC